MTFDKFRGIESLIGNTPLLEIFYSYKGERRRIFAKAEYYNLTGSIKDRIALHIMKEAYRQKQIKPGDVVAEATSGNTGISFSAIGAYLGHKVVIFMPDWMSEERINLIKSFGAEIRLVSKEEGGFLGSIALSEKYAAAGGVFLPCQFSNEMNVMAHYTTTGCEIINQLKGLKLLPDAVIAGVGTGGTIMGLARRLREANPDCKAYPLEPKSSPTLSTGCKVGSHRIQGISDEFIPAIVKLDELDEVIGVDDGDAINMARMFSQRLGIGIGISSGANFLGAVEVQNKLGKEAVVVTVFSDDNKKYLTTDYAKQQPVKEDFYSPDIELIGVNAYLC